MQFTTVRSKVKDYDIYLKSEKLVHSQQEHEKMFPSYLEVQKTSYFEPYKHCCSYFERETSGFPAIWSAKKCSSQLLAISSLTNTVAAISREKQVEGI